MSQPPTPLKVCVESSTLSKKCKSHPAPRWSRKDTTLFSPNIHGVKNPLIVPQMFHKVPILFYEVSRMFHKVSRMFHKVPMMFNVVHRMFHGVPLIFHAVYILFHEVNIMFH